MKRDIKNQLDLEKVRLFDCLWAHIVEEENQLNQDYLTARNLACSQWSFIDGGLMATKIEKECLALLSENRVRLEEEISRKKYFLLKAFKKTKKSMSLEQRLCYEYWEEELKKESPNLKDRFND